ncbi:hypothetical protein CC2G_009842 [Coprinopsis cinerea AmutBmut pab1-1]|nr:hypothetical protein CC2G_009842 [Coprinopsis cinerea AmutBmut pab1-1]
MIAVGSIAVWVFDYFEMLPSEVELVWYSNWSLVKIIYLLARIVNVVHLTCSVVLNNGTRHTVERCRIFFGFAMGAGWVEGFLLSDAIIYLQVYAFAQSRWVGRYLILQFVAGVVVGVTLQTLVIQETKWITSGIRGLHCVPVNLATGLMGALFASSIPLWVSLVIITIWTMMRKYRYCQSVILNALFRDGLVYMYGMAAFCISATIIMYEGTESLKYVIGIPKSALLNILVSRLVIQLRRAAVEHRRLNQGFESKDLTADPVFRSYTEGLSVTGIDLPTQRPPSQNDPVPARRHCSDARLVL